MEAFYKNEGTQKAYFDYKINASEFDIKRAYNEIKMFREIVTAAESAEGIVGLNYSIKGVLNNQMEPVMPSLEGSGTLSVKKVKMKAGDALVFNHLLVHGSGSNMSPHSRRAIVLQARVNSKDKDMGVFNKDTEYRTNFVVNALETKLKEVQNKDFYKDFK